MKLNIGYFYPDQLNLYGDTGNIEVLSFRARARGIETNIINIGLSTPIDSFVMSSMNIIFMGGGPDSEQKSVYGDLLKSKGKYIKEYIKGGGVGLFICGSYQLLGNYYKAADGTVLNGLGVFDIYTEHFGNHKQRCIGNTYSTLSEDIVLPKSHSELGQGLVGFENHGGRTYLNTSAKPLAKVIKGYGNNGEDGTEGVQLKNSFGTYYHGPLLAKNPHFADYLLCLALNVPDLDRLPDDMSVVSHTASTQLKQ